LTLRKIKATHITAMDPSYISDDNDKEASAMAAAMGFSSFGTQGPSKKTKFNPRTDALIDGQELASLDKGGKKGQGSGGNNIHLGKARVFGTGVAAVTSNEEEINLGDEEEGPSYVNMSLPPPDEIARKSQGKIDATLAENAGSQALEMAIPSQRSAAGQAVMQMPQGLPQRSAFSKTAFSDTASVAGSSRLRGRGERNEFWYVGYYDPSFNENPWARLEKAKDLKLRDTWPEKQE